MKYLLDTNILVHLLRGQSTPNPTLFKSGVAISIITYAELLVGAYKSQAPQKNQVLIDSMIQELELQVIPLDQTVIALYAPLRTSLESQGQRIEDFDLLIASTALTYHLTLITKNTKHFSSIPHLKLK